MRDQCVHGLSALVGILFSVAILGVTPGAVYGIPADNLLKELADFEIL